MATLTAYVKGHPETSKLGDCPFCHKALLALEVKKVPYTLSYIDFAHKPEWLQERSGGKVPVIDVAGRWIPDSDAILAYLEETYPEPSLHSDVAPDIGAQLFGAFRGYLQASPEETKEKEAAFVEELRKVDEYLQAHGPLFGGTKLNATDCAIAPRVYHAVTALPHYKGWKLPAEFKGVPTYLSTLATLPEWKATDYGTDEIIAGWGTKH